MTLNKKCVKAVARVFTDKMATGEMRELLETTTRAIEESGRLQVMVWTTDAAHRAELRGSDTFHGRSLEARREAEEFMKSGDGDSKTSLGRIKMAADVAKKIVSVGSAITHGTTPTFVAQYWATRMEMPLVRPNSATIKTK